MIRYNLISDARSEYIYIIEVFFLNVDVGVKAKCKMNRIGFRKEGTHLDSSKSGNAFNLTENEIMIMNSQLKCLASTRRGQLWQQPAESPRPEPIV